MDNSGQQAFIGKIRSALGKSPGEPNSETDLCTSQFTGEAKAILERIKNRTPAERQQLLERFREMAAPITLNVLVLKEEDSVTAAVVDLIRNKDPEWGDQKSIVTWQHPLIERLKLSEALADHNVPATRIPSYGGAAEAHQSLRSSSNTGKSFSSGGSQGFIR